ncbi:MAG TPA: hypothetical protein VM925_33950 [Labilithrix sp.]|nr:hypothetical protein [Labilithrix sp.]
MAISTRAGGRAIVDDLPLSWPRWLTATRAATAVVTVGGATTTSLLTAWIPAEGSVRAALVVAGVAMSALLAQWSCTAPSPAHSIRRATGAGVIHAMFCGGFLAPLVIGIAQLGGSQDGAIALCLAFAAFATVIGAPLGAAVGLAYSFVPAAAARVRERPSHGDVDRVLTVGGLWLLAIGAVHAALVSTAFDLAHDRFDDASYALLTSLWITPLVVGALLLLAIGTRLAQRSSFLAAARTGEDTRFRIATRIGNEAADGVLPLMDDMEPDACGSVLVRVGEPSREVLYREQAEPEVEERVVALLP